NWPPNIEVENASVARVAHELPWLLRARGDKEGLIDVLTDLAVFGRLFVTVRVQIAKLYLNAIETRTRLLEKEATDMKEGARQIIDVLMLSHLDALTYFLEMGHFSEAQEDVLQRRLQILVRLKLSYLCANSGRHQEAEKLQQDVLAYRKGVVDKAKGQELQIAMKDLAVCFHAMGLLQSRVGHFDKAISHYQQAMDLHEKLKNPVEYADSMNNLGVMLMKRGNYEHAAQLCTKALKIYEEEYFGHLPPIIGVMTGNIAVCYRNLNRLDESEEMYKKAIDISERALGRNHPNVAAALTNLGTLEVNRQHFQDAEKHFKEALAIHKACVSPPNNTDLFKAREKYVYTLIKLDKHKAAMEEFQILHDQAVKGEHLGKAWPLVWAEILSMLLDMGQAKLASTVAAALLTAGAKHDVIYTFLHKADRALKRKEPRPKELSMEYAMQQFPKSPVLLKYQAEEVLIPSGDVKGLITLLDKADKEIGAGSNMYHAAIEWCQKQGKTDMVPVILQHAADKFPDDMNLVTQMAQILRDAEKYKEAEVYASRMLSLRPDDPRVLLFTGEIMLRAGKYDQCRNSFNKVLKIAKPGSEEHSQAKSALDIVQSYEKGAK
ncbi:hypothetical protein BaRGS_00037573, partial [Batillaria attramentaria]